VVKALFRVTVLLKTSRVAYEAQLSLLTDAQRLAEAGQGLRSGERNKATLPSAYITGAYWFTASTSFANPANYAP
jgi:hypothetical protein